MRPSSRSGAVFKAFVRICPSKAGCHTPLPLAIQKLTIRIFAHPNIAHPGFARPFFDRPKLKPHPFLLGWGQVLVFQNSCRVGSSLGFSRMAPSFSLLVGRLSLTQPCH